MSALTEQIEKAVLGRHPLLYLKTPEESRVVETLRQLAPNCFDEGKVSVWTCVDGLDSIKGKDTRDPVDAIKAAVNSSINGFFVMKDLPDFITKPEVTRSLRDAYAELLKTGRACIVILSPVLVMPETIKNEICLVEVSLPSPEELLNELLAVQKEYPKKKIAEEHHSEITLALRGLALNEVHHVMHRVFGVGKLEAKDILAQIFEAKKILLGKAGYLEYVQNSFHVDKIGGLENLKEWAMNRVGLFTQESVDAGAPIPRGVLIMGVSGCGKSMSAKALAGLWHLPLFRLDMNLIFSGMYGKPEAAFHNALKSIESVAPAVLWIDEIENALGMTCESTTSEQSLTFSSFLTWMQERPPLVFVAATANRIEVLPAEVIRKGRFDHVFFCDLPGAKERGEIIEIHVRNNGVDPATIDIDKLLLSTKAWSGAEIEQAVIAGRVDARKEGRDFNTEDIRKHTISMVPLSETMEEQVRMIRDWAYQRATRASKKRT